MSESDLSFPKYQMLQRILCCPTTKEPVVAVSRKDLEPLLDPDHQTRLGPDILGAFISRAAERAYLFTDRVVDFLHQDSVPLGAYATAVDFASPPSAPTDAIKQSVKDWYDHFGWKKREDGLYMDTALFSQDRPVGPRLYEVMSHLAILNSLQGGDFVLDAASGAIPQPEYLAFSWFHKSRVCVDISSAALREAHGKLRSMDFCCLADVCHLPFRDNTFDGAVSCYTIQHIPDSEQKAAVRELYRVIKPGTRLCIATGVEQSVARRGLLLMIRCAWRWARAIRLARSPHEQPGARAGTVNLPPHQLYGVVRNAGWWRRIAGDLSEDYAVEALRLLLKSEFEMFFGQSGRAAHVLRLFETAFPRVLSRLSAYCLVEIAKH